MVQTEKVKRGPYYHCLSCKTKVAEDAGTCPNCGLVFGGTRYDDPFDVPPDEAKLRRTQRRFAHVLLAALLVVLTTLTIIVLRPVCTR